MKMEIERNNASILAYYGVEDRSADCQTFLFGTGEPVKVEVLPQIAPVYCLLSVSVSALYMRLPLASVVRRLYGWLDAACVYEFNAHSREKRIGLFSLPQHAEQAAFRMFPQYAGSVAFFAGRLDLTSLIMKISEHDLFDSMRPSDLCRAALAANATLIHCIHGWDGYSINYITESDAGWTI